MRRFRIGSVFGIPLQLDLTFLVVLPLFAYLIGARIGETAEVLNQFWSAGIDAAALTGGAMPWILGTAAALGLFVGVVLHELGHSLVAMRFGVHIESITLWIFGGIASFEELPENWRQEFTIAVAGPLVSVALGVVCYAAFRTLPGTADATRFVVGYLAFLNLMLAVFNMLPGFPMDGGRVLRALLARSYPYTRATKIAASVGKVVAFLLGLVGLLSFNIILMGVAFFIYIGATSESQQTVLKAAFEGIPVRRLMTPAERVIAVTPDTSVAALLDQMFEQRHVGYPVVNEDGRVAGVVTLDDASDVSPVERDAYTVADVMSTDLHTVTPDTDAMEAMTALQSANVGRLLVVDETDGLVGIVTRSDFMRALEVLTESGTLDDDSRRKPREGDTSTADLP
ncbi:CBS domain-containing protein [Haloarculaceae archaeon H-GB2-1]|nr:CBS domain-containing protein [Haloarculaceae archaeon H-GB1-1]MEA5408692.1 CBS domain-containing protein [Haloarculaceae archaeon H-GB2-1]